MSDTTSGIIGATTGAFPYVDSDAEVRAGLFDAAERLRERLELVGFHANTIVDLYAGSTANRKQHLWSGCIKLRAHSMYRVQFGRNEDLSSFFGSHERQIICSDCIEQHPGRFRALLSLGLEAVARSASRFILAHGASDGPNFARMRQELLSAKETLSSVAAKAAALGESLDVSVAEPSGEAATSCGESAGAEVEELTPVSALAWPIRLAEDLVRLLDAANDRAVSTNRSALAPELVQLLATASAAMPGAAGPFQLVPNRRLRDVPALYTRLPRHASDQPLAHFVQERFSEWVAHCREQDVDTPTPWRPNGAVPKDVASQPWSFEFDSIPELNKWHIEPDPSLGPWGQMMANWRHLALQQLSLLYQDWEEHRRWVLDSGQKPSLLLVRDPRPEPLTGLGALDRFDLLQSVLSRFPAEKAGQEYMWTVQVPRLAARALDGYHSSSGQVQAASLDGVDVSKLDEVLSTTESLRSNFKRDDWLSPAAQAAMACLS